MVHFRRVEPECWKRFNAEIAEVAEIGESKSEFRAVQSMGLEIRLHMVDFQGPLPACCKGDDRAREQVAARHRPRSRGEERDYNFRGIYIHNRRV